MAHDTASTALPHGTRQMAQLGFVVKNPTTAAVGSACTAMSSSIEQEGSAGDSWRSVRAEVLAPVDCLSGGSPMLRSPRTVAVGRGGSDERRPTPIWSAPLQTAASSASTDAVSACSICISACSRSRLAESSGQCAASVASPSSGILFEARATGESDTTSARSSTRETATERANATVHLCESWRKAERLPGYALIGRTPFVASKT